MGVTQTDNSQFLDLVSGCEIIDRSELDHTLAGFLSDLSCKISIDIR